MTQPEDRSWIRASTQRPALTQGSPAAVRAAQTIIGAPFLLRQIRLQHRNDLLNIRHTTRTDPYLTEEGRRAQYADQAAAVCRRNQLAVAAVRDDAEAAIRTLNEAVRRAAGTPATGVEAMLARQANWARARQLVNAGVRLRSVIAEATQPEMLHAIADELPTYLRTLSPRSGDGVPVELERWQVRLDRRFADLAGAAGADARVAIDVRPDVIALPPLLDHAQAVVESPDESFHGGLRAAFASQLARTAAANDARNEGGLQPGQDADWQYQTSPQPVAGPGQG